MVTNFVRKAFSGTLAVAFGLTLCLGVGLSTAALQTSLNPVSAEAKTLSAGTGTWRSSGGSWWYAYSNGGYAQDGWQSVAGTWYHFDRAGWMQTGWLRDGGSWYYLKSSGAMATGWQQVQGVWYYLAPSGTMQTGWQRISGSWYYLTDSGAMATGWQKVGKTWYLLGSSGVMKTGWQQVSGSWYYLSSSGAMLTNQWIDGKYWVDADGVMATNAWVDGGKYYVNATGAWDPKAQPGDRPSDNNNGNNGNTNNAPTSMVYNYEMRVLNPSQLYTDQPIILYLKTNNPNPNTIEITSDDGVPVNMLICEPYDDVRLKDPEASGSLQKLADDSGYIATVSLADTGTHGLRIAEYYFPPNSSVASERFYTEALTHVDVADYDTALDAWMNSMLATYTNASMTPIEKMEALCKAFDNEEKGLFRFDPIIYLVDPETVEDPNDPDNWRFARLISWSKPFFESYTWDSLTAPTMMCEFAERIGGFESVHNCYYDYPIKTEKWHETHYFCKVIYQGEEYKFEACPDPDTYVISSISYITL